MEAEEETTAKFCCKCKISANISNILNIKAKTVYLIIDILIIFHILKQTGLCVSYKLV